MLTFIKLHQAYYNHSHHQQLRITIKPNVALTITIIIEVAIISNYLVIASTNYNLEYCAFEMHLYSGSTISCSRVDGLDHSFGHTPQSFHLCSST